eukprot:TRINITY_DN216_c0_g1_i1.p1 TRINITY_DN216_c0_g1~~TRINITY_DN216_c0_g1_i1.p1  ORF type:complete len:942 (+),score=138.78 TRINITY_DN216_c0_g1_i1:193-3018(+)
MKDLTVRKNENSLIVPKIVITILQLHSLSFLSTKRWYISQILLTIIYFFNVFNPYFDLILYVKIFTHFVVPLVIIESKSILSYESVVGIFITWFILMAFSFFYYQLKNNNLMMKYLENLITLIGIYITTYIYKTTIIVDWYEIEKLFGIVISLSLPLIYFITWARTISIIENESVEAIINLYCFYFSLLNPSIVRVLYNYLDLPWDYIDIRKIKELRTSYEVISTKREIFVKNSMAMLSVSTLDVEPFVAYDTYKMVDDLDDILCLHGFIRTQYNGAICCYTIDPDELIDVEENERLFVSLIKAFAVAFEIRARAPHFSSMYFVIGCGDTVITYPGEKQPSLNISGKSIQRAIKAIKFATKMDKTIVISARVRDILNFHGIFCSAAPPETPFLSLDSVGLEKLLLSNETTNKLLQYNVETKPREIYEKDKLMLFTSIKPYIMNNVDISKDKFLNGENVPLISEITETLFEKYSSNELECVRALCCLYIIFLLQDSKTLLKLLLMFLYFVSLVNVIMVTKMKKKKRRKYWRLDLFSFLFVCMIILINFYPINFNENISTIFRDFNENIVESRVILAIFMLITTSTYFIDVFINHFKSFNMLLFISCLFGLMGLFQLYFDIIKGLTFLIFFISPLITSFLSMGLRLLKAKTKTFTNIKEMKRLEESMCRVFDKRSTAFFFYKIFDLRIKESQELKNIKSIELITKDSIVGIVLFHFEPNFHSSKSHIYKRDVLLSRYSMSWFDDLFDIRSKYFTIRISILFSTYISIHTNRTNKIFDDDEKIVDERIKQFISICEFFSFLLYLKDHFSQAKNSMNWPFIGKFFCYSSIDDITATFSCENYPNSFIFCQQFNKAMEYYNFDPILLVSLKLAYTFKKLFDYVKQCVKQNDEVIDFFKAIRFPLQIFDPQKFHKIKPYVPFIYKFKFSDPLVEIPDCCILLDDCYD